MPASSCVAVSARPTATFGMGTSTCSDEAQCRGSLAARASAAYAWSLTKAEMKELDALTAPDGNPTLFSTSACPNSFFG